MAEYTTNGSSSTSLLEKIIITLFNIIEPNNKDVCRGRIKGNYILRKKHSQGVMGFTCKAWSFPLLDDATLKKFTVGELFRASNEATNNILKSFEEYDGQLSDNREAVVKRAKDYLLERFLEEEEMLKRFKGKKNIVQIIKSFPDGPMKDPERWIAMKHIHGKTLREKINESIDTEGISTLLASTVVKYALDILSGLKSFEKKNVVHRDLQSKNIMINRGGGATVIDLGLAKECMPNEKPEFDAPIIDLKCTLGGGHPLYRAPDQTLTPKFDVYSLGVLMLEALSGYKGDFFRNSEAFVNALKKDLLSRRPELRKTPELNDIIDKMLSPLEQRPSASETYQMLHSWRREQDVKRLSGSIDAIANHHGKYGNFIKQHTEKAAIALSYARDGLELAATAGRYLLDSGRQGISILAMLALMFFASAFYDGIIETIRERSRIKEQAASAGPKAVLKSKSHSSKAQEADVRLSEEGLDYGKLTMRIKGGEYPLVKIAQEFKMSEEEVRGRKELMKIVRDITAYIMKKHSIESEIRIPAGSYVIGASTEESYKFLDQNKDGFIGKK